MAKTQEQEDAQSAIRNNIHDINAALSANESSFHSIVLACTQKEMIPTEVSKELVNTNRKSLQERATDLIQYMQTVVGCNAGFLGVFLTILAEKGGVPGRIIAFAVAREYGHTCKLSQYASITTNPDGTSGVSFRRQFFSSSDITRLMIILHPIKENCYQLGHHLDMDKLTLEELSRMDDSTAVEKLEFLLQKWCEQDGTLSNLEEVLVQMGKEDLVPRLYDIMHTSRHFVQDLIDTPMSFEEPIFSSVHRDEYDLVCSGLCLSLRKRQFVASEVRHLLALIHPHNELMEIQRKLQSVTDKLHEEEEKNKEQRLSQLLMEKHDLENELRQTQNIEHIQHLNSVLRDQDELIVSLTDKVDMYKEMQRSTSADVVFWKNKYDIAYTEKEEEIRKLKIEKKELQMQKLKLKIKYDKDVTELKKEYKCLEEANTFVLLDLMKTQKILHMKEQEIDEEQAQIQQGEETCNCGQKKLSNEEIQDCLKEEFDISGTCYCVRELDFSPGYQILHDVLINLGQKWKHAEITKKYCNFKIISRDGFPAKVALYTQWPYTIIECTIQGEEACCIKIVNEIIPKAIHQVLTEKALSVQLKFLCAHPDCSQDEKHFATPDKSVLNMQLVCDRTKKAYKCVDERQCKLLEACQQLMVLSCGVYHSTPVTFKSEYEYYGRVIRDEIRGHERTNLLERVRIITDYVFLAERCKPLTIQQDLPSIPSEDCDNNAAETQKGIKRVLQNNHAKLTKLPKTSLKSLAAHLYTNGVINEEMKANPSMDEIIDEFESGLEFKKRKQDMEDHCAKFFKAFTDTGGSYAIAAEEMEKEIKNSD